MNWRPKNWDEQKEVITKRYAYLDKLRDKIHFGDGLEAGADALLEALRKECGVRVTKDTMMMTAPIFERADGWLVFIPDKEED